MLLKKVAPTIRDPDNLYERDNRNIVREVVEHPLLNGVEVEVDIQTTSTRVQHALGRPARGFFITDATADVRVWRDPDGVNGPRYIHLIGSANTTIKLWIY